MLIFYAALAVMGAIPAGMVLFQFLLFAYICGEGAKCYKKFDPDTMEVTNE